MKFKLSTVRSIQYRELGFTLIETLVALGLGSIIMAMFLGYIMTQKKLYNIDSLRAQADTELSGGMDLLGIRIRQAGQGMSKDFPAVQLVNGSGSNPDRLIVRIQNSEAYFRTCKVHSSSSNNNYVSIYRATNSNNPSYCRQGTIISDYMPVWETRRVANGGTLKVFFYDDSDGDYTFFNYSSFTTVGSGNNAERRMRRSSGTWSANFANGLSYALLADQWEFYMENGYLKVKQNDNTPENVIYGLTNFQVTLDVADATTGVVSNVNAFSYSGNWKLIRLVKVQVTATLNDQGESYQQVFNYSYYPRNILSVEG